MTTEPAQLSVSSAVLIRSSAAGKADGEVSFPSNALIFFVPRKRFHFRIQRYSAALLTEPDFCPLKTEPIPNRLFRFS